MTLAFMSRLLTNRQMCLYLLGESSSNFGDFALFLAVAIWVKLLTGSTSEAGLAMFVFAAGSALLPVAGFVVDRFARRPLLILTNLLLGDANGLLQAVRGLLRIFSRSLALGCSPGSGPAPCTTPRPTSACSARPRPSVPSSAAPRPELCCAEPAPA